MRWDPFVDMVQLHEQVNRVFDQSMLRDGREAAHARSWAPPVDIYETDHEVVFRMEVPGMKPEEIDIQMTGDTLTIRGERQKGQDDNGKRYVRFERNYGAFHRAFTIGVPIARQQISAVYRDGLLEITLPKEEAVRPKQVKIEIQSAATPETTGV